MQIITQSTPRVLRGKPDTGKTTDHSPPKNFHYQQ